MFDTLLQLAYGATANTTAATVQTVATNAANSTAETWTGFIVAISTLVSTVAGVLTYYIHNPKIKAAAQLAGAAADKSVQHADDIKTLATVTYNMLPEEAKKITDAQNVRVAALEQKLQDANSELSKLKSNAGVK